MGINLVKGQNIDMGLQKLRFDMEWKASDTADDFDLDASAWLLGKNGKLVDDDHLVFYNSEFKMEPSSATGKPVARTFKNPIDWCTCKSGSVWNEGDDLDGDDDGDGADGETINVDLSKVSASVDSILITVTIHNAEENRQNFGMVEDSVIRVTDAVTGEEICKYELDEDFSTETALEFGKLYRRGNSWKFKALGSASAGEMQGLVNKYA